MLALALAASLMAASAPASMAITSVATTDAYAGHDQSPSLGAGASENTGSLPAAAPGVTTSTPGGSATATAPEASLPSAIQTSAEPDTQWPVISGLTPADGSITGTTVTFSAEYSDPEPSSGINTGTAMIHIDNRHQNGCTITSSRITCEKSGLTGGTNNTHKIEAFICDNTWHCPVSTWYITVDATAPEISAAQPTGLLNTPGTTVSAVFGDAGGSTVDPASAAVIIDGATVLSTCQASASGISCPVNGLEDGGHTVRVEVSDRVGNRSSKDWSFTVDTASIGITGQQPAAGSWVTNAFPTIKAVFQQAGSALIDPTSIMLNLDDSDVSADADRQAEGVSLTPATSPLAEGWHKVNVTVRDNAGHTGYSEWSFAVDTVPPRIDDETPTGTSSARPDITARIAENGSGIDWGSLNLMLDGINETGAATLSGDKISCVPSESLSPGTHNVQLSVSDLAGNLQTSAWSFTVPDSAPALAPVPVASSPWRQTFTEYWLGYAYTFGSTTGGWTVNGFQAFPRTYYLPWYDSSRADAGIKEEIVISNPGPGEASVNIFVGGQSKWQGKVAEGAVATREIQGATGGLVKIICPTGQRLDVKHRITGKGFRGEASAVEDEALEPVLLLPWYEQNPGDGNRTSLAIANAGTQDAAVDVYVGDPSQPESLKGHFDIKPEAAARAELPDAHGGPVRIVCTNNQPLVAASQEVAKESLPETMATGFSRLRDRYLLSPDTIQGKNAPAVFDLGNGNDRDLRVEIRIGSQLLSDPHNPENEYFTIPAHSAQVIEAGTIDSQEVEIVCTDCLLGEGIAFGLSRQA